MNWWKLLAALAVAVVAFVAAGGLVGLVDAVLGSAAALVVAALVVAFVAAGSWTGTGPNRWLSNPYWER
ncbi:hypothetical protein [Halorussus sp. AFM4]|uniref:hypothetical protein n=1 Tax=Halorussus sp. AFM4 TaxID=3421651 RepID=UPI003EBC6FB6